METLRVYRPRVVLHGPSGMGQQYVGTATLHHLEGYHVQNLDLGTLMGDATRVSLHFYPVHDQIHSLIYALSERLSKPASCNFSLRPSDYSLRSFTYPPSLAGVPLSPRHHAALFVPCSTRSRQPILSYSLPSWMGPSSPSLETSAHGSALRARTASTSDHLPRRSAMLSSKACWMMSKGNRTSSQTE